MFDNVFLNKSKCSKNIIKHTHSSYKDEISAYPGDKVKRNFHADKPNEKWLTDITQFRLPSYKCYLSAIIDCLDGKVTSYKLSRTPDADPTNSTPFDSDRLLRGWKQTHPAQ